MPADSAAVLTASFTRCAVALALLVGATAAGAQQTPPAPPAPPGRDTIPRVAKPDTVRVPVPPSEQASDTLPDKSVHDSIPPDSIRAAPNFPDWPADHDGAWRATYTFTPRDLEYYHGLGVTELLERVPGVLITRGGGFGRPVALSAYALGGGRLRIFLDGFEMLPLATGTFDVQRISLLDLRSIRVERSLAGVRIEIDTFRLPDGRPYAQIEAADGEFGSRILRGFFARPLGRSDVIQAGYGLVDTDGFARREPYTATTFLARWSHLFGVDRGVQVEYRGQLVDRSVKADVSGQDATVAARFAESTSRSDLIVRGRARVREGFWVDASVGRSGISPTSADSISPDARALQLTGRARLAVRLGTVTGEARVVRASGGGFAANEVELAARADLQPRAGLAWTGELRSLALGGVQGLEAETSARLAVGGGASVFGSIAGGARPLRYGLDSAVIVRQFAGLGRDTALLDTLLLRGYASTSSAFAGLRAGAEWRRGTLLGGAALVRTDPARVVPFGLGFSAVGGASDGASATGIESYVSVPLFVAGIRLDGWYVHMIDAGDRPYLPADFGLASLQYHNVFFTGNLEPTARLETVFRGPASVPLPASDERTTTPSYAALNFFLQIRVIDVRVFLRAENFISLRQTNDVAGLPLPGPRTIYGFRWFFRN